MFIFFHLCSFDFRNLVFIAVFQESGDIDSRIVNLYDEGITDAKEMYKWKKTKGA